MKHAYDRTNDLLYVAKLMYENRVNNDTEQPYILTYSGKKFMHLNPRPEDVDIFDIAHHLSMLCRFTGALSKFYSVAEHSVRVSYVCNHKDAIWGLLHDSPEAYGSDVNRPLKRSPGMEGYRLYERKRMDVICEKFGLSPEEPESVLKADVILLRTEQRDLFVKDASWAINKGEMIVETLPEKIVPWTSEHAEEVFLGRFFELMDERIENESLSNYV